MFARTLELRPETAKRLDKVASAVERDAVLVAHEAIERYLDDIEDYRIAEERSRDYVPGSGVTLEELMLKYGLDEATLARCALDD